MEKRIIRLSELMEYHKVKEVYKDRIACFRLDNQLVNIDTIPPAFADIFSFLLVTSGTATFSINYHVHTLCPGDMLLLSPSILVAITHQSTDFAAMNLMCERSFFEHMLSSFTAYQSYALFFCRSSLPVLHLSAIQADSIVTSMQQIFHTITCPYVYRDSILNHQLHTLLLQVLERVEECMATLPPTVSRNETLFHNFILLLINHYHEEHYLEFYARQLCISTTYLSRIIRKVTQKTAGYFITGLLFAEACRLLIYTDKTAQEIANELHFSDQSAFGKFFKTHSKVSPQQYRTAHQAQTDGNKLQAANE